MCLKPNQMLCLLLTVLLFGTGGCGPSQNLDHVKAANDTNIKKLCSAYQLYASRSRYIGPESKEELVEFLRTNEKITRNLELMGLDRSEIDGYFISENDGKEFEIRWGVFVNPDQERAREPLVFEKEGKDGIRLVMLANRNILEVDNDKKYQALLNGKVTRSDAMTNLEKEEAAAAAGLN